MNIAEADNGRDEFFYKTDNHFMKMYFIYIDRHNCITKIKDEVFELARPNVLRMAELCVVIEYNKLQDGVPHQLVQLLKYNFVADVDAVIGVPGAGSVRTELMPTNTLHDITFEPTIEYFQSVNCLYALFREKVAATSADGGVMPRTRRRLPSFLSRRRRGDGAGAIGTRRAASSVLAAV